MTGPADDQSKELPVLPVLYRRPVILDVARFAKMRLASATDFQFARQTNSVPVTVVEFPLLQRHYPIVFTDEPTPLPMAVLGLEARRNSFVDGKGRWRARTYVPAYVRRYPFLFLENPLAGGDIQYVLCIDEQSPLLSPGKGEPLYDGSGRPGPVVERAVEMCSAFQGHYALTKEFGAELRKLDLLVPNESGARIGPSAELPLRGFCTIDEARFKALGGELLEDWNRRGWLQLAYCHLLSLLNWRELFFLAGSTAPGKDSRRQGDGKRDGT